MASERSRPKVVFCGSAAVGKTTIFHRILETDSGETFSATMGAAFAIAHVVVNGQTVPLHIWDTAGQEEYRSLVNLYFRSTSVAVIVFDLTEPETFDALRQWHTDVMANSGDEEPRVIVVGNKLDLGDRRAVFEEQIHAFISTIRCEYFEVSAFEGTNINALFRSIGVLAAQRPRADDAEEKQLAALTGEKAACC